MLRRKLTAVLSTFALAGFGWLAAASAQEQPSPDDPLIEEEPAAEPMAERQQEVLTQIQALNQSGIDFALLGINRAQSDDVREFATSLYDEKQQAQRELMEKAQEHAVELAGTEPAEQAQQELMQRHQEPLDELKEAEGAEFDRQYVEFAVRTHEEGVETMRQVREQVVQEDVREHLDERIESAEESLSEARDLQEQLQAEEPAEPAAEPGY